MKRFGIIIGFSFVLGFSYAFLVDVDIWITLRDSIHQVKWYSYPLIFIFSFYFTLTLHELGHLLSFVFEGVNIRALYLTVFVFVKKHKKWKFMIYPRLWSLLGGLVVPDLFEITNEEEYEKTVKAFKHSLLTAPIVTISLLCLTLITFVILSIIVTPSLAFGLFIVSTIFITLLSMLYIYTFTMSNQTIYGDFIAYKKMNSDLIFTYAQMSQYTMFSTQIGHLTKAFLFNKAKTILKNAPDLTNLFTQHVLLDYLDGIIQSDYQTDEVIHATLSQINPKHWRRNAQSYLILHELILYYYKLKDVEKAYQLYEDVRKIKLKSQERFIDFMMKKTANQIHLETHDVDLSESVELLAGDMWIFKPILNLEEMHQKDHEKLPYVVYECKLDFDKMNEDIKKSDI